MNEHSSNVVLEQKMAAMRIKNLELLKRHQEIEEDRQLAEREGRRKEIETMRGGTMKSRARLVANQPNSQDNPSERVYRPPIRRKFESDRNDIQPQRAQRVDYSRLKRDRARELTNQKSTNTPELHEYAFHYRADTNNDPDEPSHARKLVIVNNNAPRIGSGRFNQQQQGQRKREERMRRSLGQNNGHTGGTNEFHLDVPSMPIWPNSPVHVQLIPTNLNGHPTGIDHLINTSADPLDQSAYMPNFVYSPTVPFNGNGPVYFAHPPPSSQPSFHPYHPTNSTRPQYPLPIFSSSLPQQQQQPMSTGNDNSPTDLSSRFRHFKPLDHETKSFRPMSNEFERLHNNPYSPTTRFNSEQHRFQFRPQTFYDFSSNNVNNNNFSRSSNNHRHLKNNNNNNSNTNNLNLPLSAYMNTNESSLNMDDNRQNNHRTTTTTTHPRRRTTLQPRSYHQDKHQFPLSSYDPRHYGFNENSSKRNQLNNRWNANKIHSHTNEDDGNVQEIDLIEEWWEDNNTDLIETEFKLNPTTIINDSGNSSLSTSINLKETTSDISTTDSNIIESLDKLQEQLKLEEAVDERIALSESNKEPTTYDTAHFMQWAKEKFRQELAGRLTAQEIEQHDAVTTDDDDPSVNNVEKMDALQVDLHEKLTIDEHQQSSN